jgi:hypothetical protein
MVTLYFLAMLAAVTLLEAHNFDVINRIINNFNLERFVNLITCLLHGILDTGE